MTIKPFTANFLLNNFNESERSRIILISNRYKGVNYQISIFNKIAPTILKMFGLELLFDFMDPVFIKKEEDKLKEFFGQKIFLQQPNISNGELDKFQKLGFVLHFLPALAITEDKKFLGWHEPPKENFYQLIEKKKLSESACRLPGKWILIDKRPKPQKKVSWIAKDDFSVNFKKIFKINAKQNCQRINSQQYEDDFLLSILKANGFRSRFSLTWREIDEIIKPEAVNFLGIEKDKIRLPRFIEWNFLGNAFYPEWAKTSTWEWFNDRFKTGECLTGGSNSLSIVGWDSPDFWSTILGFRILIEV